MGVRLFSGSKFWAGTALTALIFGPTLAAAHDIEIPLAELRRGVDRIEQTIRIYQTRPAIPPLPQTPHDHRRILGAAEIELALGNRRRALQLLMGRLADPKFRALPEYVDVLLMTSQVLEESGEPSGAMHYAEQALVNGGDPQQMAEAGARWFRVARRTKRLDRRLDLYELWRSRGGEKAAGTETAASVMYEAAFALRADQRREHARALLAKVPSESRFGSRSAYLSGVMLVEQGNLESAEKWFAAIMEWPIVAEDGDEAQKTIEKEVREYSALSAGRLRYERGDLDGAAAAYALIQDGSPHQREACWERAYLDLDRGRKRAALKRVRCVTDLGARGSRHVDARLFQASLLAHIQRYSASIESYQLLHADIARQRDLFAKAVTQIARPAEFLFEAMERNAVDSGRDASPGAPTLFADAWNSDVDRAYRVDRDIDHSGSDLNGLVKEVEMLTARLSRDDAFVGLELRKQNLERLLREIEHLVGHAGTLQVGGAHASTRLAGVDDGHDEDQALVKAIVQRLRLQARRVEQDIRALDRVEAERRAQALQMLAAIKKEALAVIREAQSLEAEAAGPVDGVARNAIQEIHRALEDAAMRAEVGVLDTYWLKKQHRTKSIENLLQLQKETEQQVLDAIQALDEEESAADAPAAGFENLNLE